MQKLQLEKYSRDQWLGLLRTWISEAKQEAQEQFFVTQDADRLTYQLAAILDHLIHALYMQLSQGVHMPVAVIATGGYGRREQCPYSDVDLLFLYTPSGVKEASQIAESLLYFLWDIGLKVGQAHRNIEETLLLAQEDIHVRTSLLDARLIVGDSSLFAEMMRRFHEEVVANSGLEFVEAKLVERDVRHARFGDSRYMLEPNVKEGKGGLRDLHTLWWMARYVYHVQSLDELQDLGHISKEELDAFHHASRFLLRTRAHLHYMAGHADERLTFDKQTAMARVMGYRNASANVAITRFMRRYFMAVRTVGSLTRILCALLEDEKKRRPRKPLGWVRLSKQDDAWFELDGERLTMREDALFEHHPLAILQLFYVAQEQELDIHPRALRAVTRNLHRIDLSMHKSEQANTIFLKILRSDKGPEITLRRMNEAGVLGRFIPEFGRIIGQTQFNMYHVYTVDEHTLVALGILHMIDRGMVKAEAPLASEIMPRITQKHVLYLALFCHDIAKGRGGDHSELGEKIAVKLGKRFGFTQEECDTTAWLVRHHLLLSNTAFKRDINDPKTISDFVAIVRTPERLKLLLVLTVADIRAVAPGVWNEWKGALMRDIFNRAIQSMGSGEVVSNQSNAPEMIREAILSAFPELDVALLDEYMALGTPSYWAGYTMEQHLAIAQMLLMSKGALPQVSMDATHDDHSGVTEVLLSAMDRHGLFAIFSGAIALAGATIISAKIFTLKDGRAVDVFEIQDMGGHLFDRPSNLARIALYAEQAMSGAIDLKTALTHRARPYDAIKVEIAPIASAVFIENAVSSVSSVIEVSAADRVGLLCDIASTLSSLGLSIITAHISTYGMQAADVFYVKDEFGMKIEHAQKIRHIREALLAVL